MALDPQSQFTVYIDGSRGLLLRSVLDGEVVAEKVPLGHLLLGATSNGNMIATIGQVPYSVIIINDWREHELHQLLKLSREPVTVAISAAQDKIAVLLRSGMTLDEWMMSSASCR